MRIEKIGRCYVAHSDFAERTLPKAAGFWWHGGGCRASCLACIDRLDKVWWTADKTKAARLLQYADASCRAELSEVKQDQKASRATDAVVDIPKPDGYDYLPFQRAGIAYAMRRPSTLIADEMGLGKTIQALGVVNADPSVKTVLVVCPATLRLNWRREAERWLVRPMRIHVVEERELPPVDAQMVIVNYEKMIGPRGEALKKDLLARSWDLLVADEAHYMKNDKAQRTICVLGKRSKDPEKAKQGLVAVSSRRLFLTGTPILNKPRELWPLVNAIANDVFSSWWGFAKRYCGAYEDRFGWNFDGATNLDELQEKLRGSIMVRRLKKDVLTELPAKRRQVIDLAVNGAAKIVAKENASFLAHEQEIVDLQAEADLAHAAGNDAAYKEAVKKLHAKTMVAFNEMAKMRHETALAKVPKVIEHVKGMLDEGVEKVILFAHHHDVVAAFEKEFGDVCVVLTGETAQDKRTPIVDRFQTDPAVKVFIGSITAAGVGITLTAASNVVFAELDWVPGNVTQAEDRCHRIGQQEQVLIQHLVLDGSLDARMAKILVAKQEIADKALDIPFERDLPVVPHSTPRPAKYPPAPPEQKAAALEALRMLAGVCDGGRVKDECGFNRIDTRIGKALAMVPSLTDGQFWLARRILPKYHLQVGWDLLEKIGFKKKEA
jgi:hypothetical protein